MYLQICSVITIKCICRPGRLQPASSHNHGLLVPLQTPWTTISRCFSRFTRTPPPSLSPNSVDCRPQVHPQPCWVMSLGCTSEFAQSSYSDTPQIALKLYPQPVLIYFVYVGSDIEWSMRIQSEYIRFKNHQTISTSNHFQVYQQHSQRKSHFSQTTLQWVMVLPGFSSALPDLSSALPGLSLALPGAPRYTESSLYCCEVFVNSSSPLPWYSGTSHQRFQLLRRPAGMPF